MVKHVSLKHPSIIAQLICLLGLSVVVLVGITLTSSSQNTALVQQELSFNALNNVESLSSQLGDLISRTNSQMELLLTNEDVRGIYTLHSSRSTSEQYKAIDRVLSLLKFVLLENDSISGITLYYPELNRYLSTSAPLTGEISADALEEALCGAAYGSLSCQEGKWYLYYAHPFVVYSRTSTPLYYARVELDADSIQALLASFRQYHALNLLMHVESGSLITPDKTALSEEDTAALFRLAAAMTGEQLTEEMTLCGKLHTVLLRREPCSGCVMAQLVANASLYGISRQMYRSLFTFTLTALTMILVYWLFLRRYIHRPLKQILEALRLFGEGNLEQRLPGQRSSEFDALATGFNRMAGRIGTLVETNYRQEILLQQAHLKQLQMQISPHFLYNGFYFIENAIDLGELHTAQLFLRHLAEYYRFITRKHSDLITLQEEYTHVLNYLALQQMRFGEKLTVETPALPAAWAQMPVPRLILQPLAENTIQHGRDQNGRAHLAFDFSEETPGTLCIRYIDHRTPLTDEGWNNLLDKLKEDVFPSSALGNIYQRLRFNAHEMQARRLTPVGLEMILLIHRKGDDAHGAHEHTDRG